MKLKSIGYFLGSILFLAILSFLFVKFTGVGSSNIYGYTGWNITGDADKKWHEQLQAESQAMREKMSSMPQTSFHVDSVGFDFGNIPSDQKVNHTYTLTNTGTNPLIIGDVRPSCGCTVADYSKEPIPPGETGTISISFDPTGKMPGSVQKNIMLYLNSPESPYSIFFKANIIDKK